MTKQAETVEDEDFLGVLEKGVRAILSNRKASPPKALMVRNVNTHEVTAATLLAR